MSEEKSRYLCGGVLFFLIANATPDKTTAKDHRSGIKESHKDSIVMSDLISVLNRKESSVTGKDTSLYRECDSEGSTGLPFENPVTVSEFNRDIISNYSSVLKWMRIFADKHISEQKQTWLVRALLEIIELDEEILDSDLFFAIADGKPITKEQLKTESHFMLEPFLLGVFNFIVQRRQGKNHKGKKTLDLIGIKTPGRERTPMANLGNTITREIRVTRCGLPDEDSAEGKVPNTEPEDHVVDNNDRLNEDPQVSDGIPVADRPTTVIHHQTNIIQNGPNNSSVTNYGPVVFNWGGGKNG